MYVLKIHTFFEGKIFDSKREGKNNDDCVLKGISKKHFFSYQSVLSILILIFVFMR